MDEQAEHTLRALGLPSVDVIPPRELEDYDREFAAVAGGRSHAEYCWTAQPALCAFVLDREPGLEWITYLDADMEFFAAPKPLFEELGDASVMLSTHRYAPEFRAPQGPGVAYEEPGGLFNAHFTTFRRDAVGLAAVKRWRDLCIEWCRDRVERDRYAGQKYLDELPVMFPGVRVSAHIGGGLAPWNVSQYRLEAQNGHVLVNGVPVIFHHLQSLELHPADAAGLWAARRTRAYRLTEGPVPLVWTTGWRLTERELSLLWDPYIGRLSQACRDVMDATGTETLPFAPVRRRRVAFQVARRRIPPTVRTALWRARAAVRRRRGGRAVHPARLA